MFQILDIGHRSYPLDQALSVLETEVSEALANGRVRALKVIHGHGTGRLRQSVRAWCREQRGRFRAVIPGEEYDLLHRDSMDMRAACGLPKDPDFGRHNRAVTYIWLW